MKFIDRLLGAFKNDAPSPAAAPQPDPAQAAAITQAASDAAAQADLQDARQVASQASHARLDSHWETTGLLESDALAYLVSPGLSGGPDWPSTRQAYRVVRRGEAVLLATDGLSEPFDDIDVTGNGFGMELFLETWDLEAEVRGEPGNIDPIKRSWAFELLENIAGTVADAGGIVPQLEQYGVLSLEIPGVSQSRSIATQLPERFVTDDDCLGVLLGGLQPDFPTRLDDMPLSPVILVPVLLLTASELEYVRTGGAQAREELVQRLTAARAGCTSSLRRASVA